ncbi:MAG: glycosyltransferase family 1 protein [Candidatus Competibacteraceae bacterium]|nr:glycosyltransferase family 1 protein [Candidatus Competibacteraceae bacterium]
MKIIIATDAWHSQVNGVVRTLETTTRELQKLGHEVWVISPCMFRTYACPIYPEIRMSILPYAQTKSIISRFRPDAIHIATEGPIGQATRRFCKLYKIPFSTSYHTKFPEYLEKSLRVPAWLTYRFLCNFHKDSSHVLVTTETMKKDLEARGFRNLVVWGRGVDTSLFNASASKHNRQPKTEPRFAYIGRVSIEKNLESFLDLDLPGKKVIVGEGPVLDKLKRRFPNAEYHGFKQGAELAMHYATSDVFVFPSKTDTFGMVMLEAMACGTPVAAYPIAGPIDVVKNGVSGCLNDDLRQACLDALELDRRHVAEYAKDFSWGSATKIFEQNLTPICGAKWRDLPLQY